MASAQTFNVVRAAFASGVLAALLPRHPPAIARPARRARTTRVLAATAALPRAATLASTRASLSRACALVHSGADGAATAQRSLLRPTVACAHCCLRCLRCYRRRSPLSFPGRSRCAPRRVHGADPHPVRARSSPCSAPPLRVHAAASAAPLLPLPLPPFPVRLVRTSEFIVRYACRCRGCVDNAARAGWQVRRPRRVCMAPIPIFVRTAICVHCSQKATSPARWAPITA